MISVSDVVTVFLDILHIKLVKKTVGISMMNDDDLKYKIFILAHQISISSFF